MAQSMNAITAKKLTLENCTEKVDKVVINRQLIEYRVALGN